MDKFLTCSLVLASLTFAAGCSHADHANHGTMEGATTAKTTVPADSTTADGVTATYTCPMHPKVRSNTPGQCPTCGMDLVKK